MNLELNGTVAVVVGAAKGIGRAVADGFAAEGAFVACVDRDERIEEMEERIQRLEGTKRNDAPGTPKRSVEPEAEGRGSFFTLSHAR